MLFMSQRWATRAASFMAAVLFVLATISSAAFAQTETGQIIGTVTDPNGAVVSGASVTVKSVDTGSERTGTSDEEGVYTITSLQPGLYEVTVEGTGFAPSTQRVQITVGSRISVDTALSVTAVGGDTVTIVAGEGGVEVNTSNQELSNVISGTQVRELPSLTRNPYDFVTLSGNVAQDPNGTTNRGVNVAINGQRAASTNILLDGADNNNTFSATVAQSVPLDSVQEYRVITSNFSAEYGRAGGGIVNVATRAGSNDFRGSVYEFNRISRLASNGFNNNARGLDRAVFTRNQFGYAIGGPVVKNKLFFFNSTEWTRIRSVAPQQALVPTQQLLAASSPNTRSFFSAYGTLAAQPGGTVLTVADVVRARAVGAGAFASLPGNTPAFQLVNYNVATDAGGGLPQNAYSTVVRFDYNLSDKTQIYGRYALEDSTLFEGTNSSSPFSGFSTGTTDFNNNILVSLTHTFTPNFVSQTKAVYNRLNNLSPLGDAGFVPTLYFFPNSGGSIAGTRVANPGIYPFNPGVGGPFGGPQNLGQAFQDFNYQAGKHQFRFGGQYVYIQDNRTFGAYSTASATLGRQGDYTDALNNFVLGQLRQFQAAVNPQGQFPGGTVRLPVSSPDFTRSNRYNEYALYVNDAYRVHPRVTLNLGMRYEYYSVQRNKDPNLDSNFYFGAGRSIQERIRSGSVQVVPNSSIGEFYEPDKNNFAPRLGFAVDVFGDGSTSIRGGYGMAYERNFGNVTFNVIQNPPNYAVISVFAPEDFPTIPLSNSNAGPLAGSGVNRILPSTSLRNLRPDLKTAYTHQWSLAVERQLDRGTVASLEFSASAGRDLYSLENINRIGTGPRYLGSNTTTPTGGTSSRLNGQYSNLNTRGNNGRSNYAGLTASLEGGNFRDQGLQFTARYTIAKAADNLSSTFSESDAGFNLGLTDPFDPNLDYGLADFDIRHRFSGSFNYSPTFFRNTSGLKRQLLDGFTLTGLFVARTGTPYTVFDCTNAATTCLRLVPTGAVNFSGSGDPRPDPGDPVSRNIPANRFIFLDLTNQLPSSFTDISGFTEVGPFPENMTRRNAFRAPGFYDINMGLYKTFKFGERYGLQLRAEAYNLLNHANLFVIPAENEINNSFGTGNIRGVSAERRGRRNVQLAVKFNF